MSPPPPTIDDHEQRQLKYLLKIAEKVRTGEYYRDARNMYDFTVNDPMSERYIYVFITTIALMILTIVVIAVQGLYPLDGAIPLTYLTHDIVEDLPHIQSLQSFKNENPGEALLRFLVKHYVITREEYDIGTFDRDVNGIKSSSSDAVYKEFQQFIDPRNAESPIKVYQRHSKRKIAILSTRRLPDGMEVIYEAAVDSRIDVKKSHWRANISFQYSGVELDSKSDKVNPLTFVVTDYHSKRLQDIK